MKNMDTFEFLKYMVVEEHNALEKLFDKLDNTKLSQKLTDGKETDVTIGDRLSHTIGAEYRMSTYLYKDEGDDIENFKVDPTSLEDIIEKSKKSKERHLLTLDNLSESDLEKVWTSKASGNSYSYKFLLWHFIEHIATHRGQVAMGINNIT